MSRTCFASVGVLMAWAVLVAAGCSAGVSSAPPTVTETVAPSGAVETWPSPSAEQPSAGPSVAPPSQAPTPIPSAVAPTSVPTPKVTPKPTYPPATAPWVYEATFEAIGFAGEGIVLANGDVLLVDGTWPRTAIRDARSGVWQTVPGLPAYRSGFGLVALPDGRALAVGGINADGVSFSSVYAFDPATEAWRRIGLLNWARTYPGVALLPDGRVLVVGGLFFSGEVADASAAILATHREAGPGRVELADVDDGPTPVTVPYATVEIFDPVTGTAEMARPMACARGGPDLATLADGRIMVAELADPGCGVAEIYDPATGSFEQTGDLPPLDVEALERQGVSTDIEEGWAGVPVPLGDGGALLSLEAWQKHVGEVFRALRYHPATNRWTQFGTTAAVVVDPPARTRSWSLKGATLVPLDDGRVFVAGGSIPPVDNSEGWGGNQTTARIFDPYTSTWASLPDMPVPMDAPLGLRLADGSVLLIGRPTGSGWWGLPPSALRYDFR